MKLLEFSYEKFRSVNNRIIILIHDISIFIGQNGGGKTAILDALDHFFNIDSKINFDDINYNSISIEDLTLLFSGIFHLDEKEIEFFKNYNPSLEDDTIKLLKKYIKETEESYYFIEATGTGTNLDNLEMGNKREPYENLCVKFNIEFSKKTTVKEMKENLIKKREELPQGQIVEKEIPKDQLKEILPIYICFSSEASMDPKREMVKILSKTLKEKVDELKLNKEISQIRRVIEETCHKKIDEASTLIKKYYKDIHDIQIIPDYDVLGGLKLNDFKIIKKNGKPVKFESEATGKRKQIMLGLYEWSNLQITEDNNRNFLIAFDEPDLHFDYIQISNLLIILKQFSGKQNVQVIIATHSIKLIDNFTPIYITHFKLDDKVETNVQYLTDADYDDFGNFLKDISYSLGFRSAFLFFEKMFVILEGESEFKAFPILFELVNGRTHIEAGISFINADDNIQALKFAEFLRNNKKKVLLIIDRDSKKNKNFQESNLNKLGFRVNVDCFYIGEETNSRGEFETEFTIEQWTEMMNLNYPKEDRTAWTNEEIKILKTNKKFSEELRESIEKLCNERVSKPVLAVSILKFLKDKAELSENLRKINIKLNSILNSI